MRVAVALVMDKQRVLITQRARHKPHGGLWEFPGGKIEPGEAPLAALIREVKEEVGLDVLQADFLYPMDYAYPHQAVQLLIYRVSEFQGEAMCCETQMDLRWVDKTDLHAFEFPEANQQIIARMSAGPLYLANR
ncbi:MAG TPA: 8-oxo-dGTP diphosphatase MutT [Legionella sp.]|nr:8-oxo-dGTP diphosphatase MutT [Legionella sp.]